MYNRREHDTSHHSHQPEPVEPAVEYDHLNLVDQYLALVLAVLTEAGLLDVCELILYNARPMLIFHNQALISMVEELPGSGSNLARKAVLLLGEVLQAANRLLPLSYAAKIQVPRECS